MYAYYVDTYFYAQTSARVEGTLPKFEVKLSDHQLSTVIKVSVDYRPWLTFKSGIFACTIVLSMRICSLYNGSLTTGWFQS